MKNIVWLKSAKLDLIEIKAYYSAKESPKVAANLLKRMHWSPVNLTEQRFMCLQTMDDDILEWQSSSLP